MKGFSDCNKTFVSVFKPCLKVRKTSIFRNIPLLIDLMQTLVPCSLIKNDTDPECNDLLFFENYKEFYLQWFIVEEELRNHKVEAVFLKIMINCIRKKKDIQTVIEKRFKRAFDVNYTSMQKNLIVFAERIRQILFEANQSDQQRHEYYLEKMKEKNLLDIFKRFEKKVFPPIVFMENARIVVFDLRGEGSIQKIRIQKNEANFLNKNKNAFQSFFV
jgi:hypothetical protein